MAAKKILAVVGATGAQGGGLVRAILTDPNSDFTPRAIVRDIHADSARALADRGAEVVAADLDDPESVRQAFDGAYGAYCVTFYWAHMTPEIELKHAYGMAEAARDAGLQHVIWSTLEDTRQWVPLHDDRMPTLLGKYKVPHFDAKGEADQFFLEAGVPTTFLLTTFYWDNLIFFGAEPKRDQEGVLAFTLPMGDKKLAGVATEDIGKCAYAIFKRGQQFIGERVGIAGGHLTGAEMAAALSNALGEEVRYTAVSPATYRSFGFPGADDLGNMFQVYHDFEEHFVASRDLALSHSLNPSMQSFEAWLGKNGHRIPIEQPVSLY